MATVSPTPVPGDAPGNLRRLFTPRSIAVVGGQYAEAVVAQCDRMGYGGEIWAVNPRRTAMGGRACVPSLADLPGIPDAAFLGVNRHQSVAGVSELSAMGAGGAVVFASGFGESDDQGKALQIELKNAAGDMPVLGPNCYGFINYLDGALLWPDTHGGARTERGVALVMQSSNMAITLSMARRALPLGYLITLGNQACVGMSRVMNTLLDDPRVSAIGLHIEGIDDAGLFIEASKAAAERGVPLVALKVGRTASSKGLAHSHTASLAGTDEVIDALLKRLSIPQVDSLPVLIETLKLLHAGGPLKGHRLVSLSCSGGEAALMADRAAASSVELAQFSDADCARIGETVNPLVSVSNPFDYHTYDWHRPERLYATHQAVMQGDQDITSLLIDFPKDEVDSSGSWDRAVDAFVRAAESTGRRAVTLSTLPECMPESRAAALMARGIVPLLGVDDGLAAIAAAARVGKGIRRSPALIKDPQPVSEKIFGLSEWEAKRQLSAYGIETPKGFVCNDVAAAIAAAREIDGPVAMKVLQGDMLHKTDTGALLLDVRGDEQVRQAFAALAGFSGQILVEAMVEDSVAELIVGAARDALVGLHLLVGAGGVMAELIRDDIVLLPPVERVDVFDALRSLRLWPVLDGFRGRSGADIDAVVDTVLAVQRFVGEQSDALEELDINPLIVRPRGAVAADALIRFRAPV